MNWERSRRDGTKTDVAEMKEGWGRGMKLEWRDGGRYISTDLLLCLYSSLYVLMMKRTKESKVRKSDALSLTCVCRHLEHRCMFCSGDL